MIHRIAGFATSLCVVAACSFCRGAEPDFLRYSIDGVHLSGNYNVRYLKADPIDVRIDGRPAEAGVPLVDGQEDSSVTWGPGEPVDVVLDMGRPGMISGITVTGFNPMETPLRLSTSADGENWSEVDESNIFSLGTIKAAGGLAAPGRYVRLEVVAQEHAIGMRDVYVYGEKTDAADIIGGIYPSAYPPIAGQQGELRVVVRNLSNEKLDSCEVSVAQVRPIETVVGATVIENLAPRSARVAILPWTPQVTEPHELSVRISAADGSSSHKVEVIPVVKRPVVITGFVPLDNERLRHSNLYTTTSEYEYYPTKLRGDTALAFARGPHGVGEQTVDFWEENWSALLDDSFCDGIALDEWGDLYPAACKALNNVFQKRNGKLIASWLAGVGDGPEFYASNDLFLDECYLNLLDHNAYRSYIVAKTNAARNKGVLDRWIIVLGNFTDYKPSTLEQLEREVQYLRYRAPEIRGVGFYGYSSRDIDREADELGYKYFIAPVVMQAGPVEPGNGTVRVTLKNIGGMNAREVAVEAVDEKGRVVGTSTISLLEAGAQLTVDVKTRGSAKEVSLRILTNPQYTVLPLPAPVEVLPKRQISGGPIQVCFWIDNPRPISTDARLEIADRKTGQVRLTIKHDPSWKNTDFYLRGISTKGLTEGHYVVRLVEGEGKVRASDSFQIVPMSGTLAVRAIDGKPWTGSPNSIQVRAGETFELTWDLGDSGPPSPCIYVSGPGDELRMPRSDGTYAMTSLAVLRQRMKAPEGEPMRVGRWTWPTEMKPDDLSNAGGWFAGIQDAGDERANMSLRPGTWKLWIGDAHMHKTWSIPHSPVLTVEVLPAR